MQISYRKLYRAVCSLPSWASFQKPFKLLGLPILSVIAKARGDINVHHKRYKADVFSL